MASLAGEELWEAPEAGAELVATEKMEPCDTLLSDTEIMDFLNPLGVSTVCPASPSKLSFHRDRHLQSKILFSLTFLF